jgi:hypothetical protein
VSLRHRPAVDEAGAHLEPVDRLNDRRVSRRPVVAVPGQKADADRVSAGRQPIAVVLDLVDPIWSEGWALSRVWKAGFDKAGRGTLQHAAS